MVSVQTSNDQSHGTAGFAAQGSGCIEVRALSLFVSGQMVLDQVSFTVPEGGITAVIGASGSGKSSLLRAINRMWDGVPKVKIQGSVRFADQDVYARGVDVRALRTHIGMVFQRPAPFVRSIYENIALTLRAHGIRQQVFERVEQVLVAAGLWDEVKDRLSASALSLSGGQQQRLCIARALALGPTVLLLDEPQSALDPRSREQITQLMLSLKSTTTIVLVTHHLGEAERVSDRVGVMVAGKMGAFGVARDIFASEPLAALANPSPEYRQ